VEPKSGAGGGGSLIYLPLDKLIRGGSPSDTDTPPASPPAASPPSGDTETVTVEGDRSRGQR